MIKILSKNKKLMPIFLLITILIVGAAIIFIRREATLRAEKSKFSEVESKFSKLEASLDQHEYKKYTFCYRPQEKYVKGALQCVIMAKVSKSKKPSGTFDAMSIMGITDYRLSEPDRHGFIFISFRIADINCHLTENLKDYEIVCADVLSHNIYEKVDSPPVI